MANKINDLNHIDYPLFLQIMDAEDSFYTRALYSQAVHETADFTSRIWKETKNAFGMRPSVSRHKFYSWKLTTGTGDYAGYDTHKDTISDRVDLDRNFNRKTDLLNLQDVADYMAHVKEKGYATDPEYVRKWKFIYNREFPQGLGSFEGDNTTIETGVKSSLSIEKLSRFLIPIGAIIVGFFLVKKFRK